MTDPTYQGEPIFHLIRCAWCWREVKSTEAIHVGEKDFCCDYCKRKDFEDPETEASGDTLNAD